MTENSIAISLNTKMPVPVFVFKADNPALLEQIASSEAFMRRATHFRSDFKDENTLEIWPVKNTTSFGRASGFLFALFEEIPPQNFQGRAEVVSALSSLTNEEVLRVRAEQLTHHVKRSHGHRGPPSPHTHDPYRRR